MLKSKNSIIFLHIIYDYFIHQNVESNFEFKAKKPEIALSLTFD